MNTDEFERQLQQQPLRSVPADWREKILETARAAPGPSRMALAPRSAGGWREWLWPCPPAWAALAAIWVIILGLQLFNATSERSERTYTEMSRPSTQVLSALAEQRRLLIEVSDAAPPSAAAERSPAVRPRSARRVSIVCV